MLDLSSSTLLIVDDVAFNRDIVRQLLKEFGDPKIFDAENGLAALEILEKYGKEVEFVIADFEMPVCHGLQLLKSARIGERGIDRGTWFAMVTAFSDIHLVNAALALDVNAFLVKPVSRAMLGTRLADMMARTKDQDWLKPVSEYENIDVSSDRIAEWKIKPSGKTGLKFLDAIPEDWLVARKISVAMNDLAANSGDKAASRIMETLDEYVTQGALRLEDISKVLGVLQVEERQRQEETVVQHVDLIDKRPAPGDAALKWAYDEPRLRKVVEEIGAGAELVVNIYTFDGKLFIEAGTELNPQILNIVIKLDDLGLLKDIDVALAETAVKSPNRSAGSAWPCAVDSLREGTKVIQDIMTSDGRIFMAKGRVLDQKSIYLLSVAQELGHIGDVVWVGD